MAAVARHGAALVVAGAAMVAVGAALGHGPLPTTPSGWLRGAVVFGVVLLVEEGLLAALGRAADRAAGWGSGGWREPPRAVPRRGGRGRQRRPPAP